MKKFLVIMLLIFIFAIIIIPLIFLIFGLQSHPLVVPGKKLDFEDVVRVKQLMKENDPRRLKTGDVKRVSIAERDLNLFLDYALSQSPGIQKLCAGIDLLQNSAQVRFTCIVLHNPFGKYLNVSSVIIPESDHLVITRLRIGAISIPDWSINITSSLVHRLLFHFDVYRNMIRLLHSINDIKIYDNNVSLVYQWQPDIIKKLRAQGGRFILPADERDRIHIYNLRLTALSQAMNERRISIANFLQPLFQSAKERTLTGGDPREENRALILTFAAYVTGRDIDKFLGNLNVDSKPRPGRVKATLLGREDLAKHFLVSAAISVSGGSGLANLAGIFKEMDDSRGGSGFSFADLAADRAGVNFAEIASGSSLQAKLLQQKMSDAITEIDFMPRIDNLPEGIQELEFKRQYQDLDSETYRMVENEIERRISACRIYQSFPEN